MNNKAATGHLSALITILIWGTTFISTKVLLSDFQPVEILSSASLLACLLYFSYIPGACREQLSGRSSLSPPQVYAGSACTIFWRT